MIEAMERGGGAPSDAGKASGKGKGTAGAPGPGPLGRLGGWAYRHRGLMVLTWIAAFAVVAVLSALYRGDYRADYSVPGSDSRAAERILADRFPSHAGEQVTVVVRAETGVTAAGTSAEVRALLARLGGVAHVAGVDDPYRTPGAISRDGHTLVAHLRLDVATSSEMPAADTERLLDLAKDAGRHGLNVALGGQTIEAAEQGSIGSEGIGLVAATVILLLVFGSVVAAGLPILVAVAGLAVSGALGGILLTIVDAPNWSTSMATMIGIGIGIDYTLLMVTRFRDWRAEGLEPEAATVATMDTAGRSVVVAGGTVLVSMLGLFAMGLSFMRGAALVTIVAVLVVMLAGVTLFPAMLGYLGRHVDRLRLPFTGRDRSARAGTGPDAPPAGRGRSVGTGPGAASAGRGRSAGTGLGAARTSAWQRWSGVVRRYRVASALAGLAVLLVLAAPFLGVRFAYPDAGNSAQSSSTRRAYDAIGAAFGPGANGPLLLTVSVPDAGGLRSSTGVLGRLATAVSQTRGVAAVAPAEINEAGDTAVVIVVPTGGPQDSRTQDLVHRLRNTTIPEVAADTPAQIRVGGATAASIDSTANIAERLPLLVGGVVLLSTLLLIVAFRSIAIAIKAALMNLLSVVASYGVVTYVLGGGWAGGLVGIDTRTPLAAFIPVLMFAALFGLSMDYEVFLISRMRETWVRTRDNTTAVTEGLAGTGRVITAAAAIMIAVFAAFVPSHQIAVKTIGVGMATAILIDATVIRMLLVPAVMHLLGRATWWLPARLARLLPEFHVEGRPEVYRPHPEQPRPETARPEVDRAGIVHTRIAQPAGRAR